jgi:tRNA dimethylallyltransferase
MEILTGQPDPEMLSAVPHHLVGCLSPAEALDAARFVVLARKRIAEVFMRGKQPIVTGGSGLYIKALTHGLTEVPPANPGLRSELAALSLQQLQESLAKVDPATQIDLRNPRRVLRALEISILTGRPASEVRRAWDEKAVLDSRGLLLVRDRAELHARIARNVRTMFERGVVEEVGGIEALGPTAAMAIGLREIQSLRRGEISKAECIASVVLSTRRYAKRQLTWFRNQFTFQIINLTGLRDTHEIPHLAMDSLGVA